MYGYVTGPFGRGCYFVFCAPLARKAVKIIELLSPRWGERVRAEREEDMRLLSQLDFG